MFNVRLLYEHDRVVFVAISVIAYAIRIRTLASRVISIKLLTEHIKQILISRPMLTNNSIEFYKYVFHNIVDSGVWLAIELCYFFTSETDNATEFIEAPATQSTLRALILAQFLKERSKTVGNSVLISRPTEDEAHNHDSRPIYVKNFENLKQLAKSVITLKFKTAFNALCQLYDVDNSRPESLKNLEKLLKQLVTSVIKFKFKTALNVFYELFDINYFCCNTGYHYAESHTNEDTNHKVNNENKMLHNRNGVVHHDDSIAILRVTNNNAEQNRNTEDDSNTTDDNYINSKSDGLVAARSNSDNFNNCINPDEKATIDLLGLNSTENNAKPSCNSKTEDAWMMTNDNSYTRLQKADGIEADNTNCSFTSEQCDNITHCNFNKKSEELSGYSADSETEINDIVDEQNTYLFRKSKLCPSSPSNSNQKKTKNYGALFSKDPFNNTLQQLCKKFNSNNNSINLNINDNTKSGIINLNDTKHFEKIYSECDKELDIFFGIIRKYLMEQFIKVKPNSINGKLYNMVIYNLNDKTVAIISKAISNDYQYEVTSSSDESSSCNRDIQPEYETEDTSDLIVTTSPASSTEDSS